MRKLDKLAEMVNDGDVFSVAADSCPSDHGMQDWKGYCPLKLNDKDGFLTGWKACYQCWGEEYEDVGK